MRYLITIITFLLLTACASEDNTIDLWVNSIKVSCDKGAGQDMCMQVQPSKEKGDDWVTQYAEIKDFDYVPGFFYHLQVRPITQDNTESLQDITKKSYELVKVIDKKQDKRLRLQDIWLAQSIEGKPVEEFQQMGKAPLPQIEFDIATNKMFGTDGCNRIAGEIANLDEKTLSLKAIALTRKACKNMEISNAFNKAINKIHAYSIGNNSLTMFDTNNKEILTFKKID